MVLQKETFIFVVLKLYDFASGEIEMKMSTKSVVKKKKLQTTLGKAIEIQKEETGDCLDVAHLKKPIETSIYGLREIVSLLQNATNEV